MPSPLRLNPAKKKELAKLLEGSYDCINPRKAEFKTSAKDLKEAPRWYLARMGSSHAATRARGLAEQSQKLLDWSSWELARSTLDQSVKDSVGLLLYVHKVSNLEDDPLRMVIPSFDTKYISDFVIAQLYFDHLHAVMSGLCLAGFVVHDGHFIVRDARHDPRWKCVDPSWSENWSWRKSRLPHALIFEQYDSIQGNQINWVPPRTEVLKNLKEARETVTYHMERMGSWKDQDTIEDFKGIMKDHIAFQRAILSSLCEIVEHGTWDRSFDPNERTSRLETRFEQYRDLADAVL